MYSTYNEEQKSVIAERFIRTLKIKIQKYMTSVSQNVYIDKLDDIVNIYNITYNSTIKMKPANTKLNTCIGSSKGINNKDPKFKIGDIFRISKYKIIFAKGQTNWSKTFFMIKEDKNTVSWTPIINDLNGEEIVRTFHKKELQETNQYKFRIKKVIKKQ